MSLIKRRSTGSTHSFGASAGAGAQARLLPIRRVRPLEALNVLHDELAVTAHADHLATRRTLSRVARQQTRVRAAVRPRLAARLLTNLAVATSLKGTSTQKSRCQYPKKSSSTNKATKGHVKRLRSKVHIPCFLTLEKSTAPSTR